MFVSIYNNPGPGHITHANVSGSAGWEPRVPELEVVEPEWLRVMEQAEVTEMMGVPEVTGWVPEVTERMEMPEHRFP
jgi:hypothetical protein